MRYTRSLISFVFLIMFVGLALLFLISDFANAGLSPCSIGIEKIAIPADNTPFDFSVTGDQTFGFTLRDPNQSSTSFNLINSDTVDVTEEVPLGWVLDEIECTEPPGVIISEIPFGIRFLCMDMTGPGDAIQCNFINRMEAPPTQPPPTLAPISEIPTISQWGLISLAVVLGILGIAILRLRKVPKV